MNFISKSLIWKLIMPIVGFFFFVLVGFSILLPATLSQNTTNNIVTSAINTAEQFKKLRTYYSRNILQSVVNADSPIIASTDHQDQVGVIPVPATFLHDVSYEMSSDNIQFSFSSPFPFANRANRQQDDFDRKAWQFLTTNPDKAYSELTQKNGKTIMRVGVADILTAQDCVNCHNSHPGSPKTDWQLGDVRGILEMSIDISAEQAADQKLSWAVIGTMALLLIAVLVVISLSFSRSIKQKVTSITQAVDNIVDGDLSTELDCDNSQDELSIIMKAINRITQQYRQTIELITNSANQLKEKADALNHITVEAQHGTQRQSQLTTATENSMQAMLTTVSQVADNAAHATDSAVIAQGVSEQGQTVVQGSVTVIEAMSEQAENSSNIIGQLQGNVEKIGTVSAVIGSIAEQTNLLALNAAIEAARAGEQGRGFAVVADEVRALASKTMHSTGEIDNIIQQLQSTTTDLVSAISANTEQASAAVEQIQETKRSLSGIGQQVNDITLVNNDIKQSTDNQTAVANDVSNNISQIAEISAQVEQGTEQIGYSAEELNQLAEQMRLLCQKFRLN